MGLNTVDEYHEAAINMAKSEGGIVRKVGSTLFKYDPKYEWILIINAKNKRGIIKTFHKAHNGLDSFNDHLRGAAEVVCKSLKAQGKN